MSCESEIGNLDVEKVILAFKQNVLWLQVAMYHTLLVAVSQCVQKRAHQILGFAFGVVFVANDGVKQLAANSSMM